MKRLLHRLGAAFILIAAGAMLAPMAIAEVPSVSRKPVVVAPKTSSVKVAPISVAKLKPVAPRLQRAGTCGIGQTQCFLSGGKVPASIPAGSPDNVRPKTCVFNGDPQWSCGKCERCVLYKTEGAFCGPKGCDYKRCLPNFADLDGNRGNGCETWVPIKKPVPRRQPPANPPARACQSDADCGSSPDIRCVKHRPATTGSCEWWHCQPRTNDCSYLPSSGNFLEGAPACMNNTESDGHGCGYSYPSCPRFKTPVDVGLCRLDTSVADVDGDGFPSAALLVGPDGVSDGTDCDDGDPARFPGNTEVCDAYSHDEDCDPSSNGAPDADHDGQPDAACCNLLANGSKSCGTDCDDRNPALALAGKRCLPNGQMELCTVDSSGGGRSASWVARACGAGSVCVPQPDGTGVCQLH